MHEAQLHTTAKRVGKLKAIQMTKILKIISKKPTGQLLVIS